MLDSIYPMTLHLLKNRILARKSQDFAILDLERKKLSYVIAVIMPHVYIYIYIYIEIMS